MSKITAQHPHLSNDASKRITAVPLKAKLVGQSPRSISTTNDGTIANLSNQEKDKVSRLVQRLLTLGQEHELALAALKEEKDAFSHGTLRLQHVMEDQIAVISEKLRSKDCEIEGLEAKNALSTGLLALYQSKLKNSADMFRFYELSASDSKIKIQQLESDLLSLQALVGSQKQAIESFEASRARHTASMQDMHAQQEAAALRQKKQLREIEEKLAERDMRVAELQREVQRLSALCATGRTNTHHRAQPEAHEEGGDQDQNQYASALSFHNKHQSGSSARNEKAAISEVSVATAPPPAEPSDRCRHIPVADHTNIDDDDNYDMYGPMYASLDTSAISLSSSHHAGSSSRHDLSAVTYADGGSAAGKRWSAEAEDEDEEEGEQEEQSSNGAVLLRDNPRRGNSKLLASSWEHTDSNTSSSSTSAAMRTALDPTPMKRKSAARKEPHTEIEAERAHPSAPALLVTQTPAGARSSAPTSSSSSSRPRIRSLETEPSAHNPPPPPPPPPPPVSVATEKKKTKKSESGPRAQRLPATGGEELQHTVGDGSSSTNRRKGKGGAKKTTGGPHKGQPPALASSTAALRHRTFDASGPEVPSLFSSAVVRGSHSALALVSSSSASFELNNAQRKPSTKESRTSNKQGAEPAGRLKKSLSPAPARATGRAVIYDDSLFNLLSEMDLSQS